MADKAELEHSLREELDRNNYSRAVILAQELGHKEDEIHIIKELAIKRMAFHFRNGYGVRKLADEWNFSKAEIEMLLHEALKKYENNPEGIQLGECYDIESKRYLTLRQWVEQFLGSK